MKKCLIVVPLFNEESALPDLIKKINDLDYDQSKLKCNVLFINDGSTDGSNKILKRNGVNYLSLVNNLGIGGAVQCGYMYAYNNDYDYVIQIDGDGQHPPNEINKLIQAANNYDEDLIIGSRFISKSNYKPSIPRRIGMIYSSFLMWVNTGVKILDTTSGFRLTKKNLIYYYSKNYPQNEAGLVSLLIASKGGYKFKEIPIVIRKRQHGKSSINILRAFLYPSKVIINSIAVAIMKAYD